MKRGRIYYYQDWHNYSGACGHMLRFYFKKPDAEMVEISGASYEAWYACHRVVVKLPERDASILREYYSADWDGLAQPEFRKKLADANGMNERELQRIIDRTLRLVAIERGLADR